VSVLITPFAHATRLALVFLAMGAALPARAQTQAPAPPLVSPTAATPVTPPLEIPPGYTIGPDDVLNVMFWRDKEMTADVVVRPDGRITLPLVNDVVAVGLTPEQLRDRIKAEASRFVEEPSVTVIVKQINSRRVFITGMVGKPGAYPMTKAITVLQLISLAGGLDEYANTKNIMIMRRQDGQQVAVKFNYNDVRKGKNLKQNIELQAGDTVVVP
jgi:polysaccharide export outer membrane protein